MTNSDSYQQCISWLFEQFPSYQVIGSEAYKPTLQNIRELLDQLNHPEKDLNFLHVAGSNGKGSVCAYLTSISVESGYKTGLFTSPHIKDFRERIRINGECISENEVVSFVDQIKKLDLSFSPSFFEITFAMALDHFRKNKCEICVIETGLGGRLDATNIIEPEISIITTISLEHQNILGDTLEKIAKEKAGIIKKNTPVVLGNINDKPKAIMLDVARENNSPLYLSDQCPLTYFEGSPIANLAAYQIVNLKTALTAFRVLNTLHWQFNINLLEKALSSLKQNSGYFGRLEITEQNPLIIFDVSHNKEGIEATLEAIENKFEGQLHIIYGTSADKDISGLKNIFPENCRLYLTTFSNPRSVKMDKLKTEFQGNHFVSTSYWNNPIDALKSARNNAGSSDCILITGSFFLVSEFY